MPQPTHRWLTALAVHLALGAARRRLVVRGWPDVTCQRCLGSIHGKLAQLQRQQPENPGGPPSHPWRGGADPHTRAAERLASPLLRIPSTRTPR